MLLRILIFEKKVCRKLLCECLPAAISTFGAYVTLFVGGASGLTGSQNRQRAGQAVGFATMAIAIVALIGQRTGLPLLSSWMPGFASVKPLTALCLAVLGLAIIIPARRPHFALVAGLAVAAAALLDLAQSLFGAARGIDSTLGLVLAGSALALSRFERSRFTATALAGLAGAVAVFILLGYLTGVAALHGPAPVGWSALPTAVALLCAACGIILRTGIIPAHVTPQPLSRLQLLPGCAIIAPLLLFGVYAGSHVVDAQRHQVRADLMDGARALSAAVDREIIVEIKRLQILAASPSLRQGDFAAFRREAETAAVDQGGNITLVDRDMQQIINTSVPPGSPLGKTSVPKSVETALATGTPQFSGLFTGPVTHQLLFAVVAPVQIDGENRYALVRSLNQGAVASVIAAHGLRGWQAAVSDAAHRVVARSMQEETAVGNALPQAQWSRAAPGGVFEFTDSEGRPSLEAYVRSALTGWETAVWQSKAVLDAPVRTLWRTLGWLALMASSLAVASALGLGRLIAGALGHVAEAVAALGESRPLPANETPVAEVNALMDQFREVAARRQAFESGLRQSEATFRSMFDASSVGKVEIEFETGRLLRVNNAMCKLVGYSREELLQRTVWDITPSDEHEQNRDLIRLETPVFDKEIRYIRKDGEEVWTRVTANVILDEAGWPVRCAVIQDLTARKQAEQALQASKDRLQLAFDATRFGWWQYDPLRRVISGDERANEIFGIPKEGIALEELEEMQVHPDDVQGLRVAFEAAIDPADPKPFSIQYRIRREGAGFGWVETHGLAYFEGAGPLQRLVGFVGTVQDITERKEREEKERLLMREINHRAKNMLSVVDAIAHQTAARSPEDFVERFSERIQALSANQDLLVRSEWSGIEITDLVRAQLAHFADLIGSRITLQGSRLRLNPASAQAIGLAVHELATNAGKYGALSTDKGCVDVAWDTDGETFTMSWTERDGPPVFPPKRRGFGSTVIEAMTARSVDGAVQLDYGPAGVSWRLTCPAAMALEPDRRYEQ